MTTKNLRVTPDTHLLITTLADILGTSVSSALEQIIKADHPEVVEAAQRRAAENKQLKPKISRDAK